MRRRWNILIWSGFAIVLLGLFSVPFFVSFPATRDFPWANLLLIVAGMCVLGFGVKRAFSAPELYPGKISGSVLSVVALLIAGFFSYGVFFLTKGLPAPSAALRVGQPAPAFTLASATGDRIELSELLRNHRAALLIFYRGYW